MKTPIWFWPFIALFTSLLGVPFLLPSLANFAWFAIFALGVIASVLTLRHLEQG